MFDCDYVEIARILARTEATCRQIVHRARFAVPGHANERLLVRFLAALEAGDRDALLAVFDEDATWTSDGGAKVAAARNALQGAARIARVLLGIERKWPWLTHRIEFVNGEPAVMTYMEGRPFRLCDITMRIPGSDSQGDGRVQASCECLQRVGRRLRRRSRPEP